jgi:hypothetical protein
MYARRLGQPYGLPAVGQSLDTAVVLATLGGLAFWPCMIQYNKPSAQLQSYTVHQVGNLKRPK